MAKIVSFPHLLIAVVSKLHMKIKRLSAIQHWAFLFSLAIMNLLTTSFESELSFSCHE